MILKYLSFLSLSLFLLGCGVNDDITKKDSPTTGTVNFYFDEGLTLHINNQISTFKTTYEYAKIYLTGTTENNCIAALFNDSCKVIAINRELTKDELAKFSTKNIHIEATPVSKNAIALIVSKNNPDSVISIDELTAILKGTTYEPSSERFIIFDNQNSGSSHYLKNNLLPNSKFGANCSAITQTNLSTTKYNVNTIDSLVAKVSKSNTYIGICDYAWFSDNDDLTTKKLLANVKLVAVSKTKNQTAYMPDQSNIATGDYPLTRQIVVIRRAGDFSLAKGIQTFMAGEKGQLMFLKQGLPPHRQEERVIEINMEPMKVN